MRDVVTKSLEASLNGEPFTLLERPDDEAWQFEELYYCSPVYQPPLSKLPQAINALSDSAYVAVRRNSRNAQSFPKRVFLSRENTSHRRLLNEEELSTIFGPLGFVKLNPESIPFEDQVCLFRGAEAIIGAKGAALSNIIFSEPDTIVLSLAPSDNPDPFFLGYCRYPRHRLRRIVWTCS